MAEAGPDPHPPPAVDRLSDLPEPLLLHILSLLPTDLAVRASLLSHRFQLLWLDLPAVNLASFATKDTGRFFCVTQRVFRRRVSPSPILSLRLSTTPYSSLNSNPTILHWFFSGGAYPKIRRLRHLSLDINRETLHGLLPLIFNLETLEALSLHAFSRQICHQTALPPKIQLGHLKSLRLDSVVLSAKALQKLVASCPALEDLYLKPVEHGALELSSPNLRRLDMWCVFFNPAEMTLNCPKLELLKFESLGPLMRFRGKMPVLRSARVKFACSWVGYIVGVRDLLWGISNVLKLTLHLSENQFQLDPFLLLKQDRGLPRFPNLRNLDLTVCFHDNDVMDLMRLMEYCPALESMNLIHLRPKIFAKQKVGKVWVLKRPWNRLEGCRSALLTNLGPEERNREIVKLLRSQLLPRRLKGEPPGFLK